MRSYFPRLIGNDETKIRIGKAIESGRLPHAFLIGGPSGSGKSTLAIEMAAAINCLAKDDLQSPLPCGKCNCCKRIYEGNFPDFKILEKKKDKATLGVEPVKDFREDMFLSSTEAESKIYLIDDAECMTPEAQNALLKVLEEPPRSVIILLLATECDRILTTIKSRAQYIAMSKFEDEQLASTLLSSSSEARMLKASDEEKFRSLIRSSDGRLGLAKSLLGKKLFDESQEERSEIIDFISAISKKASYANIYQATSRFPNKRVELSGTLERLMNALRDLLTVKYDSDVKLLFFSSRDEAQSYSKQISTKRILAAYDVAKDIHELCSRNANVSNLLATLSSQMTVAANN